MKRIFFYLLLGTILLFFSYLSSAQQKVSGLISGKFENSGIEEFVRELEALTGRHFYYNPSFFDSLRITISVSNQPLPKVLDLAFQNTSFRYSMDSDNHVFLTRGMDIPTQLIVKRISKKDTSEEVNSINNDLINDKNIADKGASSENKLYEIGTKKDANKGGKATIAGYLRNVKTGEPVVGASVFINDRSNGVISDQYGYYSLTIPQGRHTLNVQGIGMKDATRQINLFSDGKLNIDLMDQVISLKEVVLSAQKVVNITRVQLGIERLDIKTIKQVPTVFGETDILRVVLALPGVKSVGEASTGFNVRGGSADQNLILFNDATIYNPSHFFGFFSAFNPDVIKNIELYKSSIPAKYGGRLSSILDITSKEGNKKNISGIAGIGLVTSRVTLEGPITRDKTSFILGGRTTYANWLLNLLPHAYRNSKASFYDLNLIVNHQINTRDYLYFTAYTSKDHFNLNSDTSYSYSNNNISLKWKHTFSAKLTGTFTTGYDRYHYSINSDQNPANAYKFSFDINQINFKSDFNFYSNDKHTIDFGLSTIRYKLHPGSYMPVGKTSLVAEDVVDQEQAQESALYIADRYTVTNKLSFNTGIRYSLFNYLGPQTINEYAPGLPREDINLTNSKNYNRGAVIKTYHGPEFRFSSRYSFTPSFSIKAGYNSLRQYIHMLSNTSAIAPTDIWKLSDPNIKPQYGDQVSLGLYKNLKSNTIEISFEIYYKRIKDYLDYKSGAMLVLNHTIETDIINTKGKAYGAEIMIKKQTGKLNGWISYTYSRILLKIDDPIAGEAINRGEYYPANYDKPQDVTFICNYRFSHRFSISLVASYSTGRPITLPIGRFYYGSSQRVLYADRNSYRIPDYFRSDFSMNIEGNHKVKQKTHNSWTIGVYNMTGRKNPYSVYFISENGLINGYKLSIFGSAVPFINYNIRF